MPYDRVTTGTSRVVEFLTGTSPQYNGLFKKLKVDGYKDQNKLITIEAKPKGTIIKLDYQTPDVSNKNIKDIWEALANQYGLLDGPIEGPNYLSVWIGTKEHERNKKEIRFEKTRPGGGGVIPTSIQEKGATIVLTSALKSKGAIFKSDKDIRNNKTTWDKLVVCFKGWEHRLDGWLWTYYQQNEQFFKVYSSSQWEEFEFGNKDFVQFFKDHMDHLNRDFKNPDGTEPAGKYETWNPSDIWAVKKNRMQKIKDEIKAAIPDPSHLLELNSILVKYMEDHELVGISLKKVKAPRGAEIHLHNVEGSKKLRSIVNVFSKLEQYDMSDIDFEPDNIISLNSVTTYVRLGPNNKFTISITRSGNNTSFTAQIKRTPDAQGGQTPINQVVKLLGGNEFSKSERDYPQTAKDFISTTNTSKYKKYFNLVSQHLKSSANKISWDEWQKEMIVLYAKDERDAKVTLMQLTFWYSAITRHGNNAEFWTDMLYYGMKITAKGEFAPHAKIS